MNDVLKLIESRKKHDNADNFRYVENLNNDKLYAIFYQNSRMKSLYKEFGEILFFDATYNLNINNYANYNFVVQDCHGRAELIATALVAYEREVSLNDIIEHFLAENDINHTKV